MSSINYNKFIKKMRKLGFEGPFSGGKHLFMTRGDVDVMVPNPHGRQRYWPWFVGQDFKPSRSE